MSRIDRIRCDACDEVIPAGSEYLGVAVEEEEAPEAPEPGPPKLRERRRRRHHSRLDEVEPRNVSLDFCRSCAADPVALAGAFARAMPPRPENG